MDLSLLMIEILVALLGLAVLITGLVLPVQHNKIVSGIAFWGMLLILAYSIAVIPESASLFNGVYQIDLYGHYFKILFLAAAVLVMLMSNRYTERFSKKSEFYGLVILATTGMMLMAAAGEFITLYIGLELMTISFYILTAYLLEDKLSGEAGLKYLILGALSSAILLFGVSLVYAMSGTVNFSEIGAAMKNQPVMLAGLVLILAGFAFKISVVPFHMWTPDIYQGAPIPITAYLSVGSKAAGFAALIRVLMTAFGPGEGLLDWNLLLAVLAAITILTGNLIALVQQDIKRLLAYSSIAQAGYILAGAAAANAYGLKGVLFYAMIYVFANVGAFAVATAVETDTGKTGIEAFAGLSKRSPMMAAIMSICMLSLAGIPPMAGFAGKFYLFAGAIQAGYLWLAVIGLVMSMVSVYYYLNVAKVMYIGEYPSEMPIKINSGAVAALWICVIATIVIGCYPGPLSELAGYAIQAIM
ncbi:MAG TPA: NADH-quinone oxidoreductase subunit N [Syntrophomonadaceae bacterium]|nr:NADH-quinone oxidoreductase subunit N [Syntrophomonadaceae bacterium]HNX28677.1 NADH-quinone oxidoreductase subunit N [Syntrophomonadaceae bacterium]HPR93525.1 NADH-quinone oxidoreductase subunit N [Syntrophomonadaceae bacterium]